MPFPSVSYTFSNGTTSDGPQLTQNYADIINALTDGTKDLNVLSITTADVTSTNLTVSGALAGARESLQYGPLSNIAFVGTDKYISSGGTSTTSELPFIMPRAGSIVGYGFALYVTTHTGAITLQLEIQVNGATVITGTAITTAGVGHNSDYDTFARGTYAFAAGDRIAAYVNITSAGNIVATTSAVIDVQFDT